MHNYTPLSPYTHLPNPALIYSLMPNTAQFLMVTSQSYLPEHARNTRYKNNFSASQRPYGQYKGRKSMTITPSFWFTFLQRDFLPIKWSYTLWTLLKYTHLPVLTPDTSYLLFKTHPDATCSSSLAVLFLDPWHFCLEHMGKHMSTVAQAEQPPLQVPRKGRFFFFFSFVFKNRLL